VRAAEDDSAPGCRARRNEAGDALSLERDNLRWVREEVARRLLQDPEAVLSAVKD
jgi:hypothetical protein